MFPITMRITFNEGDVFDGWTLRQPTEACLEIFEIREDRASEKTLALHKSCSERGFTRSMVPLPFTTVFNEVARSVKAGELYVDLSADAVERLKENPPPKATPQRNKQLRIPNDH